MHIRPQAHLALSPSPSHSLYTPLHDKIQCGLVNYFLEGCLFVFKPELVHRQDKPVLTFTLSHTSHFVTSSHLLLSSKPRVFIAEPSLTLQLLARRPREPVGGEAGATREVQGECSYRMGQQTGVHRAEPLQRADRAHGRELQLQSAAG